MKTILITGATDGIGLAAAELIAADGHNLVLHGRSSEKLAHAVDAVSAVAGAGGVESCLADLSDLAQVSAMVDTLQARDGGLDVIVNNAGILQAANPITADGLDVRFVVNTIAPYLLAKQLLPLLPADGRIVNLSSAAQAPVDTEALEGKVTIAEDFQAYSQSKLALTMWSHALGVAKKSSGPLIVALNPGSLIGTKMVKEGLGIEGSDISIGANIIYRSALDPAFANAFGEYFDNDAGDFGPPHPDALDEAKAGAVIEAIENVLERVIAP